MTDTAAKRQAALGVGRPFITLATPDGEITAEDSAVLCSAYTFLAPPPPVEDCILSESVLERVTPLPTTSPRTICIPVTPGVGMVERLAVVQPDGSPCVLDDLTRVDVHILDERASISCGRVSLSTEDADSPVTVSGAELFINFGAMRPYPGTYFVTIVVQEPGGTPVVLAGEGYPTRVKLQVAPYGLA